MCTHVDKNIFVKDYELPLKSNKKKYNLCIVNTIILRIFVINNND